MTHSKKNKVLKEIARFTLEVLYNIVFIVILVAIIRNFLISPFSVHGASMEPTLDDGDFIMINKVSYRFGEPQRGDIVVFKPPLTKRDEPKFETTLTTDTSGKAIYEIKDLRAPKQSTYCENKLLKELWIWCTDKVRENDMLYIIPKNDILSADSPENIQGRQVNSQELEEGRIEIIGFPEEEYIVQIYNHEGTDYFVKRIMALEGDTILIENGRVYLKKMDENEFKEVQEVYLSDQNRNRTLFQKPTESNEFTVPEDHYFVMGDNRLNSHDSRSFTSINEEPVPFVHRDQISGKVGLVLLPLSHIHFPEHGYSE